MKKIFTFILLLFFVASCGYGPIYVSDKDEFNFNKSLIEGDKKISKKIDNNFSYLKNSSSDYDLIIFSKINKNVASKNNLGNPEVFNMFIEVSIKILKNDKAVKEKIFSESKSFNNTSSQFKLKQKEENISKNLIKQINNDIRIFLKNFNK